MDERWRLRRVWLAVGGLACIGVAALVVGAEGPRAEERSRASAATGSTAPGPVEDAYAEVERLAEQGGLLTIYGLLRGALVARAKDPEAAARALEGTPDDDALGAMLDALGNAFNAALHDYQALALDPAHRPALLAMQEKLARRLYPELAWHPEIAPQDADRIYAALAARAVEGHAAAAADRAAGTVPEPHSAAESRRWEERKRDGEEAMRAQLGDELHAAWKEFETLQRTLEATAPLADKLEGEGLPLSPEQRLALARAIHRESRAVEEAMLRVPEPPGGRRSPADTDRLARLRLEKEIARDRRIVEALAGRLSAAQLEAIAAEWRPYRERWRREIEERERSRQAVGSSEAGR